MRGSSPWSVALLVLACATACEQRSQRAEAPPPVTPAASAPTFTGTATCARCHVAEALAWESSHHAHAMQPADSSNLLGDFADAAFTAGGVTTHFSRRDGHSFVRTEGPDGQAHEYEVRFAFGIDPLQQLLLPLDRGRLQATTVAWDARPAAAGGQRWFSLHGDEPVPADDPLHWTKLAQNWNASCAECHSTDLQKGYRPDEDRYDTTWSEVSVGCEACHGPGSRHVEWAEEPASRSGVGADRGLVVAFPNDGARWLLEPGARIAQRSVLRGSHEELDACGRCHARRSVIRDPYEYGKPLLDTHRPALLDADLYTDDGQIQDEDYEWGSFLQSRMYAKGVTCSDCHDPHSGALRGEGNAVCSQCHRAEVFDTTAHHHHPAGSDAARCTACHLPTRVYMGVDARHDHSLRVPRPDLSDALATRDACTSCHVDRKPKWAADAVARWYGDARRRETVFGEALHAARAGKLDADRALVALADDAAQPAIVRATALQELAGWPGPIASEAAARASADGDPLVRLGAVAAAQGVEAAARLALLAKLLRDPIRAIRIETASALLAVPAEQWSPDERNELADALAEWRAAQRANADRPESHVNLGAFHAEVGELEAARAEYETALRLGPWFVPAYLNQADLFRAEGRDDGGERLLRRAIEIAPDSADAHHALGLLLVRQRQLAAAIEELHRAAELAPANLSYTWVYAVALHSAGDPGRAIAVLEAFHARRPGERQVEGLIAQLRAPAEPR